MAKNQWGGYRQPSNPAPVSLPGAQSSRTDGGPIDGMTQPPRYMAGLGYGKGGNMPQQEAAPLAGDTTPVPPTPPIPPAPTFSPAPSFSAPANQQPLATPSFSATPTPGFGGKPAPVQPPHPEL